MIARNNATPTINRPNTLVSGGDLRSATTSTANIFRTVENKAIPALRSAGLFAARQAGRYGTSQLPTIGKDVGIGLGVAASTLTGQPEILPYSVATGDYVGTEVGKYLQEKANKRLTKLR